MDIAFISPADQPNDGQTSTSNAKYTTLLPEEDLEHTHFRRFSAEVQEREKCCTALNERQSSEDTQSKNLHTNGTLHRHFQMQNRISTYVYRVMVLSTAAILAAVAFLTLLWFGNDSNATWRKLVLSNWITRSTTLAALVLRMSVDLQAVVATSMLAALAMEGRGIRLIDVLEMSSMRISNTGPYKALWIHLTQKGSLLVIGLLGILTMSTLGLQLSSTFLLSDVILTPTMSSPVVKPVFYGYKGSNMSFSLPGYGTINSTVDYWAHSPNQHPLFGEYSVPAIPEEGLDDTGKVIRSIIPIAEQREREALVQYTGPAFTFDARVVCMQPDFVSLDICSGTDPEVRDKRLCGTVRTKQTMKDAINSPLTARFKCPFPEELVCALDACSEARWTLCQLGPTLGGLISSLDPRNNDSLTHTFEDWSWEGGDEGYWIAQNGNNNTWPVWTGNAYLFFNATGSNLRRGLNETSRFERNGPIDYLGPWAIVKTVGSHPIDRSPIDKSFHATLCFDTIPNMGVETFNVSLSSPLPQRNEEPTVPWDVIANAFSTVDLRQQLGSNASVQSTYRPRQRSELIYGDLGIDLPVQLDSPWVIESVARGMVMNNALHFCMSCHLSEGGFVSPLHTSIVQDILLDTGSPALALQAFLTAMLRSAYYAGVPMFDININATTTSLVDRLAPVSQQGYWIVIGCLLAHVIVYFTSGIIFFKQTKFSLLDNTWSAFAQIANSKDAEVQSILKDTTLKSDTEIARELKRAGGMRKRYKIVAAADDGGAELALVGEKGASNV
ncbi:hypothetical protein P154DRAFT_559322 [Amniculicola lignicola CBS 123094]|uniref:Uncharacterized protein n=1 Tax=Amniculicola lignicola CBS 123094 TaxID=1392246 RepID=A0A6A5WYW4_9PLEO|nr:hypothetical protein P154DRAFT_559322 [Amniculicola lignicola CBS 123094]